MNPSRITRYCSIVGAFFLATISYIKKCVWPVSEQCSFKKVTLVFEFLSSVMSSGNEI